LGKAYTYLSLGVDGDLRIMGQCLQREPSIEELQRAKERSRQLDLANQKQHLAERAVSKLLLLGAGES